MPTVTGRLRTPSLAAAPASPAAGEVYYDTVLNLLRWWNGTVWVSAGAGYELGYDQITASVNVAGTTLASATQIIAGSAHTFDGQPVLAEFSAPFILTPSVAAASFNILLFEGGVCLAALARATSPVAATAWIPVRGSYRFTPSAGSHTYSVYAYCSSITGTPLVAAGAAGSDINAPAYLRFTKA